MKQSGKLSSFRLLKNNAVKLRLSEVSNHNASLISEFSTCDAELVVRQFVLQSFMGQKFIRSILSGLGNDKPAVIAAPNSWRKFFRSEGIEILESESRKAWGLEILLHLMYGYYVFGTLVLRNFIDKSYDTQNHESYAYFYALSNNNLPSSLDESFDILSWYSKTKCRDVNITKFRHSVTSVPTQTNNGVSIEYEPPPYYKIKSTRDKFSFLFWGVNASLVALKDLTFGRWWHALLFREIVKAKAVQLSSTENFASEYLFYHSASVYRPLWTYVPDAAGSKIISYFYSSFDQPQINRECECQSYEWAPSTWPSFLVWDHYQKELLARDTHTETEIKVTGPIYFSDSSTKIPKSHRLALAVFNIDPQRASGHFGVSTLADYYDSCMAVHHRFLIEIAEVSEKLGVDIFVKPKRDIGNRLAKSYIRCVSEITRLDNVTIIPSDVSPFRLISQTNGALSAPFTSPTIYGAHLNRPAAYYDPCGWINSSDPAGRGQPILQGKDQLEVWTKDLLRRFNEACRH